MRACVCRDGLFSNFSFTTAIALKVGAALRGVTFYWRDNDDRTVSQMDRTEQRRYDSGRRKGHGHRARWCVSTLPLPLLVFALGV